MTLPPATIPAAHMLTFASQARQYPTLGPKGIGYFRGEVPGIALHVDCLLFRDKSGKVRGILNHYPADNLPFEHAGNVNVFIDPRFRRRGIATKLLAAALDRWPIDFAQQRYSPAGRALAERFIRKYDTRCPERLTL